MQTKRILFNKIKDIKKSILLIGPRQTGKSTLVRGLKPDLEINLSEEDTYLRFLRDPALLKNSVGTHRRIFIDEVQRIPSLLNSVQALLDKNPRLQFFLTGSSARKLKRGKANLLPGRILAYTLGPLTHEELGSDFDLDRAMERGLLPGIYWESSAEVAKKTLRTYSSTYLREEIQDEALTRNLEGFTRFFDVVASRAGDSLDISKFAAQAMIERSSARRYFDILIDTLIVHAVEAFAKSARRRLVQHPKYYWFDVGVLNGSLGNFVASADRKGCLFEHLVLQLLTASASAYDHDIRISTYRTEAGAEVDLILERGSEIYAIEIKATRTVGAHDLRGLRSFMEFCGSRTVRPLLIYLGDQSLHMDGIQVLPLIPALQELGYP